MGVCEGGVGGAEGVCGFRAELGGDGYCGSGEEGGDEGVWEVVGGEGGGKGVEWGLEIEMDGCGRCVGFVDCSGKGSVVDKGYIYPR